MNGSKSNSLYLLNHWDVEKRTNDLELSQQRSIKKIQKLDFFSTNLNLDLIHKRNYSRDDFKIKDYDDEYYFDHVPFSYKNYSVRQNSYDKNAGSDPSNMMQRHHDHQNFIKKEYEDIHNLFPSNYNHKSIQPPNTNYENYCINLIIDSNMKIDKDVKSKISMLNKLNSFSPPPEQR